MSNHQNEVGTASGTVVHPTVHNFAGLVHRDRGEECSGYEADDEDEESDDDNQAIDHTAFVLHPATWDHPGHRNGLASGSVHSTRRFAEIISAFDGSRLEGVGVFISGCDGANWIVDDGIRRDSEGGVDGEGLNDEDNI